MVKKMTALTERSDSSYIHYSTYISCMQKYFTSKSVFGHYKQKNQSLDDSAKTRL